MGTFFWLLFTTLVGTIIGAVLGGPFIGAIIGFVVGLISRFWLAAGGDGISDWDFGDFDGGDGGGD